MPKVRQTSVQLTVATDRQVERLQDWGYGGFTDIVRIAIDRMFRQEAAYFCDSKADPDEIVEICSDVNR
jgi:hypothetical protein